MSMLEVKNLSVIFKNEKNETKAVDSISFNVGSHEVLGIVGESGSGKTITALSIMDLLRGYDCSVKGDIIPEKRDFRIAMIFQEPFTSLNPVLKVGYQIEEAVKLQEKCPPGACREKAISLLKKVKIKDADRVHASYPHLLSGGERQRVMIAIAIALRPKILIADEPTTALDVTVQKGIIELLLDLKKELGMSIVFITHDFRIIDKIASRVIVMKNGRIIEQGPKESILRSPKEEYTKKLINAAPDPEFEKKPRAEKPVLLDIKNISKTFMSEKGFFNKRRFVIKALNDISLPVYKGETLGIVGESGSGKTTLGKIIIGLIRADAGSVTASEKTNMQIVFQDPYNSLDPLLRVRDIILEGPRVRKFKKEKMEELLKKSLEMVRLDVKDANKYPHQFSGGQRQRIAIARALAVEPSILILDEPVSSLDVIIQSEILSLLKDLARKLALTYVFISHDLRVVEYMADRIAVMKEGRLVEYGPSLKIYKMPSDPYTRELISSSF